MFHKIPTLFEILSNSFHKIACIYFKCPFVYSNVYDYEYIGLTSMTLEQRVKTIHTEGALKTINT